MPRIFLGTSTRTRACIECTICYDIVETVVNFVHTGIGLHHFWDSSDWVMSGLLLWWQFVVLSNSLPFDIASDDYSLIMQIDRLVDDK